MSRTIDARYNWSDRGRGFVGVYVWCLYRVWWGQKFMLMKPVECSSVCRPLMSAAN